MKPVLTSAMTIAKQGMNRAHEIMQLTVSDSDRWLLAQRVFMRHYRIARYIRQRQIKSF